MPKIDIALIQQLRERTGFRCWIAKRPLKKQTVTLKKQSNYFAKKVPPLLQSDRIKQPQRA